MVFDLSDERGQKEKRSEEAIQIIDLTQAETDKSRPRLTLTLAHYLKSAVPYKNDQTLNALSLLAWVNREVNLRRKQTKKGAPHQRTLTFTQAATRYKLTVVIRSGQKPTPVWQGFARVKKPASMIDITLKTKINRDDETIIARFIVDQLPRKNIEIGVLTAVHRAPFWRFKDWAPYLSQLWAPLCDAYVLQNDARNIHHPQVLLSYIATISGKSEWLYTEALGARTPTIQHFQLPAFSDASRFIALSQDVAAKERAKVWFAQQSVGEYLQFSGLIKHKSDLQTLFNKIAFLDAWEAVCQRSVVHLFRQLTCALKCYPQQKATLLALQEQLAFSPLYDETQSDLRHNTPIFLWPLIGYPTDIEALIQHKKIPLLAQPSFRRLCESAIAAYTPFMVCPLQAGLTLESLTHALQQKYIGSFSFPLPKKRPAPCPIKVEPRLSSQHPTLSTNKMSFFNTHLRRTGQASIPHATKEKGRADKPVQRLPL